MSKRVAMSARVVRWFRDAPLDVAEEVLGIVREDLRTRRPPPAKSTRAKAKSTTNAKPKAQAAETLETQP